MVHCSAMSATPTTRSSRPPRPRDRLLAAAVDHVLAHGLSDLSLRELAAAIGTSHRMLHLPLRLEGGPDRRGHPDGRGSAARRVRRRSTPRTLSPADAMRAMWQRFTDPGARSARAPLLRDLRPGAAGPAGRGGPARRDRRRLGRARGARTRVARGADAGRRPRRSAAERRGDPRPAARLARDRRPRRRSTPRSSATSTLQDARPPDPVRSRQAEPTRPLQPAERQVRGRVRRGRRSRARAARWSGASTNSGEPERRERSLVPELARLVPSTA